MPSGVYIRIKPHHRIGILHTKESKEKMSKAHLGVKKSLETRLKMGDAKRGEKSPVWIKDRSKLKKTSEYGERMTSAYVTWRKSVWVRDKFKCRLASQDCNGKIEAHHILSWRDYESLRYIINNGITLCHFHHPRKREEEKRMIPIFQELLSVSSE